MSLHKHFLYYSLELFFLTVEQEAHYAQGKKGSQEHIQIPGIVLLYEIK